LPGESNRLAQRIGTHRAINKKGQHTVVINRDSNQGFKTADLMQSTFMLGLDLAAPAAAD